MPEILSSSVVLWLGFDGNHGHTLSCRVAKDKIVGLLQGQGTLT